MPMQLSAEVIAEAKAKAIEQLKDEAFKAAVILHKEIIKARRLHWFPKRIVFQLPFRLEDWYKPSCCKRK